MGLGAVLLAGCASGTKSLADGPPVDRPATVMAPFASAPVTLDRKFSASPDHPPIPRLQPVAVYPFTMREVNMAGEVLVEFVVDETGRTRDVHAVKATHDGFIAAAVQSVEKWAFIPAVRNGRPVSTRLQVPVTFGLRGPSSGSETIASLSSNAGDVEEFDPAQLDERPRVISSPVPLYPFELRRANVPGEAVIEFVVGTDGATRAVRVVSATRPEFGDAAVAAVEQWRFKPGRKAGRLVNCRMRVPIRFNLGT